MYGSSNRFTKKPGPSFITIGDLPNVLAYATAVAMVSSLDLRAANHFHQRASAAPD